MRKREDYSHARPEITQKEPAGVARRTFLKGVGIGAGALAGGALPALTGADTQEPPAADPGVFATMYSLRSMRRLKPDPIPEAALRKIVEAGIHAPSGGNRQEWGFILVRDPGLKKFIRDRYKAAQEKLRGNRPPPADLPPERRRAMKAAAYLMEHMHEAPVLLLACVAREYPAWAGNPRASTATVHASIYPAVQNILLACRALGVGATLTTTHFFFEDELKQRVGVPDTMEVSAMLPLGYPKGKFGKTTRKPVDDVLFWDRWDNKKA